MNYERIYDTLTSKDSQSEYTEEHHIIPKCMGGTDDKGNLVKLTAREHYIAHKLLTKIYPDNLSLFHAHSMMTVGRTVTSLQYEDAKKSRSKAMNLDNPVHKMSREHVIENIRNLAHKNKGDNNIMRRSSELREYHSQRMKKDNPMTKYPERNRTAKPIEVLYEDGTIENYEYAKALSIERNIPYPTVKWMLREGKGSAKHKIRTIKQR